MDEDAFQKQIEAGRKALENARQALNPSQDVASTPNAEAQILAHEKTAHKPKPKLPEPIRPVSTGFTSVSLTKAPAQSTFESGPLHCIYRLLPFATRFSIACYYSAYWRTCDHGSTQPIFCML